MFDVTKHIYIFMSLYLTVKQLYVPMLSWLWRKECVFEMEKILKWVINSLNHNLAYSKKAANMEN